MLKSTTILRTGTNCNKSRDSVDLESCIIAPSSEAQEKVRHKHLIAYSFLSVVWIGLDRLSAPP